jgi:membrane-bound lytic murein transglycosylase D
MPLDEFQYLNPHHNRPVIAGADEHTILLPIDKAELFAAKLDLLDQPLVSWQAYRMQPGDSLQAVAARFGMSVDTLRAVNGIGINSTVPTGYAVLVPAQRDSRASAETLAHAVFTTVPKGRTFYYRVTRGDTLKTIASRYAVSTEDIQRWNGLAKPTVKPGQKLRITTERAPAVASSSGARSKATQVQAGGVKATNASANGGTRVATSSPQAKRGKRASHASTGTRTSVASKPKLAQMSGSALPERPSRAHNAPR